MDWNQVLTTIGSTAVVTTAIAWLLRSIITHLLSRDLENYKRNLTLRRDRDLEAFRSDLQRLAFEHSTVFSKLHEKRITVISELYANLVELERRVRAYVSEIPLWRDEESEKKKLMEAWAAWDSTGDHFDKNRIYLSVELCQAVDTFLHTLTGPAIDFTLGQMFNRRSVNDPEIDAFRKEVREEIRDKVPAVKAAVEQEFRSLLGVSPFSPTSVALTVSPQNRKENTPTHGEVVDEL